MDFVKEEKKGKMDLYMIQRLHEKIWITQSIFWVQQIQDIHWLTCLRRD